MTMDLLLTVILALNSIQSHAKTEIKNGITHKGTPINISALSDPVSIMHHVYYHVIT